MPYPRVNPSSIPHRSSPDEYPHHSCLASFYCVSLRRRKKGARRRDRGRMRSRWSSRLQYQEQRLRCRLRLRMEVGVQTLWSEFQCTHMYSRTYCGIRVFESAGAAVGKSYSFIIHKFSRHFNGWSKFTLKRSSLQLPETEILNGFKLVKY